MNTRSKLVIVTLACFLFFGIFLPNYMLQAAYATVAFTDSLMQPDAPVWKVLLIYFGCSFSCIAIIATSGAFLYRRLFQGSSIGRLTLWRENGNRKRVFFDP